MKKLLIAALLPLVLLCACALTPNVRIEAAIAAAETSEAAAAERCPRNGAELALLLAARLGFDRLVGATLTEAQRERVDAARARTDRACGLLDGLAPETPPAPEPDPVA